MAHCQVRQNYHEDCEGCVNTQINNELHASYVYQSMVSIVVIHARSQHSVISAYRENAIAIQNESGDSNGRNV